MNEYELTILDAIHQGVSNPVMDSIMIAITQFLDYELIWVLAIAVLILIPKTRSMGVAVAIGFVLELVITQVGIKNLVMRPRPFMVNPDVVLIVAPPAGYSFPSGHSGGTFAVATALFLQGRKDGTEIGRYLWIPFAVFAVVVAFSRLYLYVHYPTDVAAGIAFGILCGWLGYMIFGWVRSWLEKRKVKGVSDHDR